jgi:hypothetical protein
MKSYLKKNAIIINLYLRPIMFIEYINRYLKTVNVELIFSFLLIYYALLFKQSWLTIIYILHRYLM